MIFPVGLIALIIAGVITMRTQKIFLGFLIWVGIMAQCFMFFGLVTAIPLNMFVMAELLFALVVWFCVSWARSNPDAISERARKKYMDDFNKTHGTTQTKGNYWNGPLPGPGFTVPPPPPRKPWYRYFIK